MKRKFQRSLLKQILLTSFLTSSIPYFLVCRQLYFPQPGEAAGGGAAAADWSLAAKNGIKSVARLDKELDSLPLLLSLWTRSCFPPRGVREGCGLVVMESGQVV